MKPLMACWRALACALLFCSCSGEGGTAAPVDNPFGTEATGASAEPASGPGTLGENDGQPGAGTSLAQICAFDCTRVGAACPNISSAGCAESCSSLASQYPSCLGELRAYFLCVESAPLDCSGGDVVTGCDVQRNAANNCITSS
jgi:hypothetical protein